MLEAFLVLQSASGTSVGFFLASKLSASQIVMWSKEAYSSSLIFPFEFELALQLVMIGVHFFTFKEPSTLTSLVEMCFMHEGI